MAALLDLVEKGRDLDPECLKIEDVAAVLVTTPLPVEAFLGAVAIHYESARVDRFSLKLTTTIGSGGRVR